MTKNKTENLKTEFERLYQRELSDKEVFDMETNLYGFFRKLYEIDQRIKKQNNLTKGVNDDQKII